jgi:polysaccharide deacetylase family protein (PEP-CTERM system associated)
VISDPTQPSTPPAAMSIDVEDWFHTENLKAVIARESWDERESRVERNTGRMLELMAEHGVRGTFFVLGWVAEKVPQLVRRITDEGHEVASHGYGHELIYEIGPDAFRRDVERARKLLEDQTGERVRGYRAPNFSITDWAIDILQETGHEYDSSAFPTVAHDRYGKLTGMDAGRPVTELRAGFAEVCVSCLKLGRKGLPWGGGGYFRLFPYRVFRSGVKRILDGGQPYVFYIHPWEIDGGQPRVKGLKASYRFRHYVNVDKGERRFAHLLGDFRWTTMASVLDWWQGRSATPARPVPSGT